jgi:hypothetical protein
VGADYLIKKRPLGAQRIGTQRRLPSSPHDNGEEMRKQSNDYDFTRPEWVPPDEHSFRASISSAWPGFQPFTNDKDSQRDGRQRICPR